VSSYLSTGDYATFTAPLCDWQPEANSLWQDI
jgi:hypothetical protein